MTVKHVVLDPFLVEDEVTRNLREKMEARVVGQTAAIDAILSTYRSYRSGLAVPGKPIGNFLFLGPTGTGKTHVVESFAYALYGNHRNIIKVDCAEYQHSHEIAKLVGSPPGYLGHRETHAALSQQALNRYFTEEVKVSLILFDEIEKSSDALWKLLLGILDKATLTLGDNQKVNFEQAMIFMTGNIGSSKIQDILSPGLGFAPADEKAGNKMAGMSTEAARRKFSPEFFNRLDKDNIITFKPLTKDEIVRIVDVAINLFIPRIRIPNSESVGANLRVAVTDEARAFLAEKGYDPRYGARPLYQAMRVYVEKPVAALIAAGQLTDAERLEISLEGDKLKFTKDVYIPRVTTKEEVLEEKAA